MVPRGGGSGARNADSSVSVVTFRVGFLFEFVSDDVGVLFPELGSATISAPGGVLGI